MIILGTEVNDTDIDRVINKCLEAITKLNNLIEYAYWGIGLKITKAIIDEAIETKSDYTPTILTSKASIQYLWNEVLKEGLENIQHSYFYDFIKESIEGYSRLFASKLTLYELILEDKLDSPRSSLFEKFKDRCFQGPNSLYNKVLKNLERKHLDEVFYVYMTLLRFLFTMRKLDPKEQHLKSKEYINELLKYIKCIEDYINKYRKDVIRYFKNWTFMTLVKIQGGHYDRETAIDIVNKLSKELLSLPYEILRGRIYDILWICTDLAMLNFENPCFWTRIIPIIHNIICERHILNSTTYSTLILACYMHYAKIKKKIPTIYLPSKFREYRKLLRDFNSKLDDIMGISEPFAPQEHIKLVEKIKTKHENDIREILISYFILKSKELGIDSSALSLLKNQLRKAHAPTEISDISFYVNHEGHIIHVHVVVKRGKIGWNDIAHQILRPIMTGKKPVVIILAHVGKTKTDLEGEILKFNNYMLEINEIAKLHYIGSYDIAKLWWNTLKTTQK